MQGADELVRSPRLHAGIRLLPLAAVAGLLLTLALSPRAAVAFTFKAPRYSTLEAHASGQGRLVLGNIEENCEEEAYLQGEFHRRTLEIVPVWGECEARALGGLPAQYITYGCAFLIRAGDQPAKNGHWTARVDVTCPPAFSFRWQVYESKETREPTCTTLTHPQAGIGTAELSNIHGNPGKIRIDWHLNELEYEVWGSGLFCGLPEGVTTSAGTFHTGEAVMYAISPRVQRANLAVVE